ncbi:MAG: carbamoyltransferase C-terminal domain-containing protein [Syntrophales bacterium]
MNKELVLGIWDGHDAGAAIVEGEEILFAVNEERLTRRKLEVGFPRLSIKACLESVGLAPADIKTIAASTTDPAKTLTRFFPGLKEEYYLIRRRKKAPRSADPFKRAFKYRFTELPPNAVSTALSRLWLKGRLQEMGFADVHLDLVDHHAAHASAAASCSGFPEALVLTLDGVGDGLSGSLWTWGDGALVLLKALPARTSLGIFFEHVTNLMNMRELEDEGKVMALANFAYPIPDGENPLMDVIGTKGLDIVSSYSSTEMFRILKGILWRYPSEQFAFMAQRVLEKSAVSLAGEALKRTGLRRMAVAGGVFSNIKMNMQLARLPGLERLFVFPHMGDGGLAIGAALAANRTRHGVNACRLTDLYLGPGYTSNEILKAADGERVGVDDGANGKGGVCRETFAQLENRIPEARMGDFSGTPPPPSALARVSSLQRSEEAQGRKSSSARRDRNFQRSCRLNDPAAEAARFILAGEIILWFQGRMEIGPRALGHRSILARPDDRAIKDRLNLLLKKRVWYQPFCPSMLFADAPALLETEGQEIRDNRFMTMGFRVRPERLPLMEGVINVDGTCRPHFVGEEEPRYRDLLLHLKKTLGYGVVLNTSFNLHGEPIVCTPGEALEMLGRTGIRYLFMGDMLIENTRAEIR